MSRSGSFFFSFEPVMTYCIDGSIAMLLTLSEISFPEGIDVSFAQRKGNQCVHDTSRTVNLYNEDFVMVSVFLM